MKKTNFPIISKRNIASLVNHLKKTDGIEVDRFQANKSSVALSIVFNNDDYMAPIDDLLLEYVGFDFSPNEVLDSKYGQGSKYYIFRHRNNMWVASGDNSYGADYTRILIEWMEKLDKDTKFEVLEVLKRNW